MEEIINSIEDDYKKLSPAERYYGNHKLAVKKYQQNNIQAQRDKCKKYYYKKKAENAEKKRNDL